MPRLYRSKPPKSRETSRRADHGGAWRQAKWDELPAAYKAIATSAAMAANVDMLAKYDAKNPAALRRVVAGGAKLRAFPEEVMVAGLAAANKIYAEIGATNADFKTIWASQEAFRNAANLWNQVAESTFDTFMIRNRPRGQLAGGPGDRPLVCQQSGRSFTRKSRRMPRVASNH